MSKKRRVTTAAEGVSVQRIPLKRIKPAAYNPRKHLRPSDPEYQRIKRSIEAFGLAEPLVWNKRTGNLVGGHQRLKILRDEFGAAEVDVSVVDLDPAEEKALNLALNKVGGTWDEGALADLLGELREQIDASVTGFTQAEIDELLGTTPAENEEDTSSQLAALIYRVIIDCKDETDQREMLERFNQEGLTCRALIS